MTSRIMIPEVKIIKNEKYWLQYIRNIGCEVLGRQLEIRGLSQEKVWAGSHSVAQLLSLPILHGPSVHLSFLSLPKVSLPGLYVMALPVIISPHRNNVLST